VEFITYRAYDPVLNESNVKMKLRVYQLQIR